MADSVTIPWNLANTNEDWTADVQNAALRGVDVQKQQGALSAVKNANLSDPASVTTALNKSIQSGAIDQASALGNLNFIQSIRQSLPGFQKELADVLGGQQGAAPSSDAGAPGGPPVGPASASGGGALSAPPAAAAGAPAAPAAAPAAAPTAAAPAGGAAPAAPDMAKQAQVFASAKQAVDGLAQLPPEQRPAAFQQVKQQFLQMGVPEQAIDAAGTDLSDKGLADLSQYYGAHADHVGALATGATPPGAASALPTHPSSSWAANLLAHPDLIAQIDAMKAAGYDITPLVTQAQALQAPEIAQQAAEKHAGNIAAETAAAQRREAGTPTELTMQDGSKIQVTPDQARTLMQTVPGMFHAPTPEELAAQSARGGAAGAAPFQDVTVMINGQPQTMTREQFEQAGKLGIPGFGKGLSPGASTFQEGDAKALQDAVTHAAGSNLDLQKTVTNGQKIAALADSVGTGKYGPAVADVAATFAPLSKNAKAYATNAGLLTQDLAGSFKDTLSGMAVPKLNGEANSIIGAIPHGTSSQQDQIKLYGLGLQSAGNYGKRYNDFMTNYANEHPDQPSMAAAQAAWIAGPGKVSILADPAFRGAKLSNGQPAVVVDPHTGWGVFMPGTKAAFAFRAQ